MKTLLPFLVILFIFGHSEAKKVKFSVDMTGYTISPMGIHVTGSFQEVAGFPGGDWQPDTSPLTNETGTEIYSIVVDIPAFALYEYKFINGDQWYETEFVPVESRVGYEFNDNRWVWIDSLFNDTTMVGPIVFSGNAPQGKVLLRLLVDLAGEGMIDQNGIHVAGSFQGWNADENYMYNFDGTIFEKILWLDPGVYEYKFFNGNSSGYSEVVPGACQQNGNREISIYTDSVADIVCFSGCGPCVAGIADMSATKPVSTVHPNPSCNDEGFMITSNNTFSKVIITDISGRIIQTSEYTQTISCMNHTDPLPKGLYFIFIYYENNRINSHKLIIH